MSFDAGEVFVQAGADFSPAGFVAFESAMKSAAASAEAFEKRVQASGARASTSMSESQRKSAASTKRWAEVNAQAEQSVHKLGQAAKIGGAIGLVGFAAGAAVAIKSAADFERAMRNVNSIAGLSAGQYKALSKSVLELSGKTAQAPKTLAEGMYQLVSSGFSAKDSLTILSSSAKAASAGLTDTKTATTAVAAVLNAYHLPASAAAAVSDTLFQTVNRGVLSFADLASTIGDVLPFASTLGVNVNQVGASFSTMTKEGISSAETATRIKSAMEAFIKPSKGMQAALKTIGVDSGAALVKQKGFQGALEAVVKASGGSQAAVAKLFPNIRALGGAFALTGKNAKSAHEDLRAFQASAVKGATDKVFAEQSKSASFQWQQFTATLQATAIAIGSVVLPQLNKLARGASAALQSFVANGGAEKAGAVLTSVFSTVGQVIGDVAPIIEAVARALVGLGAALNLGDATTLEAILAAFVAFEIVGTIAPMLVAFGGALVTVGEAAATAGSLGAFAGDIAAMTNPIGLAAVAAGALVGALVLLGGGEDTESSQAARNAAAHEAQAKAIKAVSDAELAAADKGLAARQAKLDEKQANVDLTRATHTLADAQKAVSKAADAYGKKSPEYAAAIKAQTTARKAHTDAVMAEDRASLRAIQTGDAYKKSVTEQTAAEKKLVGAAKDRLDKARELAAHANSAATGQGPIGGKGGTNVTGIDQATRLKAQAAAQQELATRVREYEQALARANVSDTNRVRLMNASKQITRQNVQGVSDLITALDKQGVSAARQARVLAGNQNVLAKAGSIISSGAAPASKVIDVLVNDKGARAQLRGLDRLVAQTDEKRIEVAVDVGQTPGILAALEHTSLGKKVLKILADGDKSTTQKVLDIIALGIPKKTALLLAKNLTAPEIAAAIAAINALPSSRTVDVYVQTHNNSAGKHVGGAPTSAKGRGPGRGEMSLVGEGGGPELIGNPSKGFERVTGPQMRMLAPDDYVIPTEQRYRGRALGFMAEMLGIPAFRAGKKPPHTNSQAKAQKKAAARPVPARTEYGGVPFDGVEQTYNDVNSAYTRDKRASQAALVSWQKAEHRLSRVQKGKAHDRERANARDSVAQYRKAYEKKKDAEDKAKTKWITARKAWIAAKKTNDADLNLESDANLQAGYMRDADRANDQGKYNTARTKWKADVKARIEGLQRALALANPKSAYARTLRELLGNLGGEAAVTGVAPTAANAPQFGGDFGDPALSASESSTTQTTFTKAEQDRIDKIQSDIALDALTPQISDDVNDTTTLIGFLQGVLDKVKDSPAEIASRGGYSAITEIAGQLQSAKDSLRSLSAPTPDAQAQIAQANENTRIANESARINAGVLAAYTSSGDIGQGGKSAYAAAGGVTVNVNTLHPGDPRTLRAIGDAATSGIAYQGSAPSPRVRV